MLFRSNVLFSRTMKGSLRGIRSIGLHRRSQPTLLFRNLLATSPNWNEDDRNSRVRRAAGVGGMMTLLLGKTKWFFAAAKLTKFSSVFSMLATTGTYAMFFGWPFAVGMFLVPFGPAVFVPFMGAVIPMQGRPKDVREEALVAIAGPIFGGVTAITLSAAGIVTGNQMLVTLADFGLMINLFNMLPIGDLDGGRISKAISKYLLLGGLGTGIFAVLNGYIHNPIFYLVLISGAFTTYGRFFGGSSQPHFTYYRISGREKLLWSGAYFGLILALFLAMQFNRKYMKSVKTLRQETGNYTTSHYEQQFEHFATDFGKDDPFLDPLAKPVDDTEFLREYFGERK